MSLLTQFYPGPGGGGSTSGASGGQSTVVFGGATGAAPIVGVGWNNALGRIYSQGPSGSNTISQITGGARYSSVTITGAVVDTMDVQENCQAIYLNGAAIAILASPVAGSDFKGVYGSGVLGLVNLTVSSGFADISTDISIVPVPNAGTNFNIQNAALTAATLNHILESLVENGATRSLTGGNKTIDMTGGTSAGTSLLTTAGSAAVSALTAAGWVVNLRA